MSLSAMFFIWRFRWSENRERGPIRFMLSLSFSNITNQASHQQNCRLRLSRGSKGQPFTYDRTLSPHYQS